MTETDGQPEDAEVRTSGEPQETAASPGGGADDAAEARDMSEEGGLAGPAEDTGAGDVEAELARQLEERTLDLKRLQAEYVNYKRRVDRDRDQVREHAVGGVLVALLPVLDDIDRAREHGELEGGFKAVADSLLRTVEGLGLQRFADKGDEFDPNLHEALMHGESAEVTSTVVDVVAQPGYRVGDRVVRPAKVTVLGPGS